MKKFILLLSALLLPVYTQAATDRRLDAGILQFKQLSATPATPSAGSNRIYFKNDGKPYRLSTLNVESLFGDVVGPGSSTSGCLSYFSGTSGALLACATPTYSSGRINNLTDPSSAQDAATKAYVDAAVSAGAAPSYSYIFLETGAGMGSTNTKVRRFSAVRENVGSAFTPTQSSVNGDKVTVNSSGTYVVCHGDIGASGPVQSGLVINGAAATTDVLSLTYAGGLRTAMRANGTLSMSHCWAGTLSTSDFFWLQGNAAADGTDTTTWMAAAKVADSAMSNIYLQNGSGHGSGSTKIRTFTNIRSNNGGSDIQLNQSGTTGDNFTILTAGNYMTCYGDAYSGTVGAAGITVNDNAVTTTITSMGYLNGARSVSVAGTLTSATSPSCYADWFKVGDVIRAHDDGTMDASDVVSYFFITKMGNATDPTIAYLNEGNGHGSTFTKTRKFSTIAKTIGGNQNKSAVEGDTIFAHTNGIYITCIGDQISGGTPFAGIALNMPASQATTGSSSLTYANGGRGNFTTGINNVTSNMCVPLYIPAAGYVREVTTGANSQTDYRALLMMKRVF